jgi:hypothetical protein
MMVTDRAAARSGIGTGERAPAPFRVLDQPAVLA